MQDYWHRQTAEKSLFPDLIWSRPENKLNAGKLLVVGGNAFGFACAAEAYAQAEKAGIGTARVALPDSLQKTVGKVFMAGEYLPSTPSGSFGKQALAELLAMSHWADGVLLAGDFGRNSETAILLEQFIIKYQGQLSITQDALDYFTKTPLNLTNRPETTIIASFSQLQKIAMNSKYDKAFTFDIDFIKLVDYLHDFSQQFAANFIVKHLLNVSVAVNGQVCTTKMVPDPKIWRVRTAASAATWWLQTPNQPFEALATSTLPAGGGTQ